MLLEICVCTYLNGHHGFWQMVLHCCSTQVAGFWCSITVGLLMHSLGHNLLFCGNNFSSNICHLANAVSYARLFFEMCIPCHFSSFYPLNCVHLPQQTHFKNWCFSDRFFEWFHTCSVSTASSCGQIYGPKPSFSIFSCLVKCFFRSVEGLSMGCCANIHSPLKSGVST